MKLIVPSMFSVLAACGTSAEGGRATGARPHRRRAHHRARRDAVAAPAPTHGVAARAAGTAVRAVGTATRLAGGEITPRLLRRCKPVRSAIAAATAPPASDAEVDLGRMLFFEKAVVASRKRLRAPNFVDLSDLEDKILAFIDEWNEIAHPFR
jgi:hypothetical protein